MVLHIDMDAFFAAIEERDNPQFRGLPIVVGADPKNGRGRGVVSTANYEARKYGIFSATPISQAFRKNPQAVFLPVDMDRYAANSLRIMQILAQFSAVVEQVSVDEAYLEISGGSQQAVAVGRKIKKMIWEQEKLTCSIGIGPNKLIAKIASDHQKPDGLTLVEETQVTAFLAKKLVTVIPGIGPKTAAGLQNLGIKTIDDLKKLTEADLLKRFGKNGSYFYRAARGKDDRPVGNFELVKSVGRQITFEKDILKTAEVIKQTQAVLKQVFTDLQAQRLKGKTLTLTVRYSDFVTHTSQKSAAAFLTIGSAQKLLLPLLLPFLGKRKPIRLIGVRVSGFPPQ